CRPVLKRLSLRRNNEIEVEIEIALADVGVLGTPGVELARFQGDLDMVGAFRHLNRITTVDGCPCLVLSGGSHIRHSNVTVLCRYARVSRHDDARNGSAD